MMWQPSPECPSFILSDGDHAVYLKDVTKKPSRLFLQNCLGEAGARGEALSTRDPELNKLATHILRQVGGALKLFQRTDKIGESLYLKTRQTSWIYRVLFPH